MRSAGELLGAAAASFAAGWLARRWYSSRQSRSAAARIAATWVDHFTAIKTGNVDLWLTGYTEQSELHVVTVDHVAQTSETKIYRGLGGLRENFADDQPLFKHPGAEMFGLNGDAASRIFTFSWGNPSADPPIWGTLVNVFDDSCKIHRQYELLVSGGPPPVLNASLSKERAFFSRDPPGAVEAAIAQALS